MSSSFQAYKTSYLRNPISSNQQSLNPDRVFQKVDSDESLSKAERSDYENDSGIKLSLIRRLRNSGEVTTTTNKKKTRSNMEMNQQLGDYCNSSSSSNNNISTSSNDVVITRVCSDCNTTKTPLWRGGPQGPKSLCNACGIRQRKARKAMAAGTEEAIVNYKEKGSDVVPYKKRSCKFISKEKEKEKARSLDDNADEIGCKRSSDVKEAARLLMALSSDVICG